MAEGVNVRLSGPLKKYVQEQISPSGLYESASEYVRTLIRQDYEKSEEQRWERLVSELTPGHEADVSEFKEVSAQDVIGRNRARRSS
jgi:putative addiction module CopG family antidote